MISRSSFLQQVPQCPQQNDAESRHLSYFEGDRHTDPSSLFTHHDGVSELFHGNVSPIISGDIPKYMLILHEVRNGKNIIGYCESGKLIGFAEVTPSDFTCFRSIDRKNSKIMDGVEIKANEDGSKFILGYKDGCEQFKSLIIPPHVYEYVTSQAGISYTTIEENPIDHDKKSESYDLNEMEFDSYDYL